MFSEIYDSESYGMIIRWKETGVNVFRFTRVTSGKGNGRAELLRLTQVIATGCVRKRDGDLRSFPLPAFYFKAVIGAVV